MSKAYNAQRSYTRRFYRDHDVLRMTLAIMAVGCLLAGAIELAVVLGIVLAGYLAITRRTDTDSEGEPEPELSTDEIKLAECDKHVKSQGGHSQKEWTKALKKVKK